MEWVLEVMSIAYGMDARGDEYSIWNGCYR